MPLTFYGFGAAVCYAGGKVTYNGTESFDAVECTVLLGLPFLPLRAVHTFDWNGSKYQFMEIRWSPLLLLRAFLLRWLASPLIGGILAVWIDVGIGGVAAVAASLAGYGLLYASDQRNRRIRSMLGPNCRRYSDPFTWVDEVGKEDLDGLSPAGSSEEAEVDELIAKGDSAEAMLVARLTKQRDRKRGETLTRKVLARVEATDPT